MTRFAFVFPGQGSQSVGMGKDLYDTSTEVKALFDTVDGLVPKMMMVRPC